MNLNIRRLRTWLVIAMSALLLVVIGFYARGYYARYLLSKTIEKNAEKLGIDVQQSTDNFSFSKSEGGHTIFTVRASKAVQVKSGRAQLHEVSIVVYGEGNNRFDQIYGSDFEYDPKSGEVRANGEVHIDVQGVAAGEMRPDQAPPKVLKNPIHLKTSGLVFNRDTGVAHTNEKIEFRIPQARGSAIGATYDSKARELTLHSQIELQESGDTPARLVANRAVVVNTGSRIDFSNARISRSETDVTAQQLSVLLRDDNTIERVSAAGNVSAKMKGNNPALLTSPKADVYVDAKNHLKNAEFAGGVAVDSYGDQPLHGKAARVLVNFGANNRPEKVRAVENVELIQDPPRGKQDSQALTLTTNEIEMTIRASGQRRAETTGPAQIVMASSTRPSSSTVPGANVNGIVSSRAGRTVATADRFIANFNRKGKLTALVGTPNAKVVSSTPGQPDKITTSDVLTLTLKPNGGLSSIVQEGSFRYTETSAKAGTPGSEATAAKATYQPDTELFVLSGSPRLSDSGVTITANRMQINRKTGDAVAESNVKTTYSQIKARPDGALFAASDPIHVTAARMTARRSDDTARYSGGARLWQGANIVEAATVDFNRTTRTVIAQGSENRRVSTVFVEQGPGEHQTPVNVTALRLAYDDSLRQAKFEGGVVMRSAEGTITSDQLSAFLYPRGLVNTGEKSASPLDRVIAEGQVVLQQEGRRGTGSRLVYRADDGSFRLTGGPPSIFDAEHGKVTGDSLTFFSRDDRVLVEGGKSAPSVTKARVIK